jgi:hypothetical protein
MRMLLVELKPTTDSLDAETPPVSGKIIAGEPSNDRPINVPGRTIYALPRRLALKQVG